MGRSVAFRDMETKQSRDLGAETRTHFHGCWNTRRQQTRSRKTLEQEVAKKDQLDRIHQRTCHCNIDHSQCVGCDIVQADHAPEAGVAQGIFHGILVRHHGRIQEEVEEGLEDEVERHEEEENTQEQVRIADDHGWK